MFIYLSFTVAGLALLLFALTHLTESLDGKIVRYLRTGLQRFTQYQWMTLLAGLVTTLIVQASSVTIISTMGFLNRGLLTLEKSLLITLGAALGSSIKGWYLSQGFMILGPLLLLFGAIGVVACKELKRRKICEVIVSIGITFLGLQLIELGLSPIAKAEFARKFLALSTEDGIFSVLRTVFFGFLLSFLLQSGSSVLILVMNFSSAGLVSIPSSLALILGANLGTTTTPLIASIGQKNPDTKRLAIGYCLIKLGAVALVLTYFRIHAALLEHLAQIFNLQANSEVIIVAFHTWFNLMNALSWWLTLPLLIRFLVWAVPGKDPSLKTMPFSIRIQKLLGSLPERTLSESVSKIQQVTRDLHWVSDGIFHLAENRADPRDSNELLEEAIQRCDRSEGVLDTVRDVAWRYVKQSGGNQPAKQKVLGLIFLIADLKNIKSILYSCINTMKNESFVPVAQGNPFAIRLCRIRTRINRTWDSIYSLEKYIDIDVNEYVTPEVDIHLFEVSTQLNSLQKLMELSPMEFESLSNPSTFDNLMEHPKLKDKRNYISQDNPSL